MDHGACNVIYVDRRAREQTIRRSSAASIETGGFVNGVEPPDYFKPDGGRQESEIQTTLESILSTFTAVHVFSSGSACLSKLTELEGAPADSAPTVVLMDVPYDEEVKPKRWSRDTRSPSPTFSRGLTKTTTAESLEPSDIYGLRLLAHIASEIQFKKLSKLIIPIAVVSGFEREWAPPNVPSPSVHGSQVMSDSVRLTRFIDAGAIDVLTSPLSKSKAQGLAVHAYRTYREVSKADHAFLTSKRNRKLSWVGVEEQKPYAYLREAMVSGLMSGICSPEKDVDLNVITLGATSSTLDEDRKDVVAKAVGNWSFCAHDYSDDELLFGAITMMEHALAMPELENWRLPTSELYPFFEACQGAYNEFVHYHNFRHAVDVMQSVFFFLLQLGVLPKYPHGPAPTKASPLASLLQPFDALTLLVSAIGHDVGHPGVNNAFLVSLNAPLAQLYNDRSVLESFHCAAYSQILRRHWPAAFKDTTLRRLMINNILATDMGLHFKYMADLGNLQEKLADNANLMDTWNAKEKEEYRDLLCGLLIKCADISNVARVFPCAHSWANILTDEFAHQGQMEQDLGIPTCLFGGPPVPGDIMKLGESQQGFMNIFACPLFESVTDVLPAMHFSVDELGKNKIAWQKKIAEAPAQCECEDVCTCSKRKDSHNDGVSPTSQTPIPPENEEIENVDRKQQKSKSDPEVLNGEVAVAPTSITATALPLAPVSPLTAAKSTPSLPRGRQPHINGNARAVSAHAQNRKPSPPPEMPIPLTASETDLPSFGKSASNGLSKRIKKLFKKKW